MTTEQMLKSSLPDAVLVVDKYDDNIVYYECIQNYKMAVIEFRKPSQDFLVSPWKFDEAFSPFKEENSEEFLTANAAEAVAKVKEILCPID